MTQHDPAGMRDGTPADSDSLRFGDFSFSPRTLELHRGGTIVPLRLQAARLLRILLEQAPATVPRRQLQEALWNDGSIVEFDKGLNTCVNQLRTVLGDSAAEPCCIETLPKRGYRWIAPVTRSSAPTRVRRKPLVVTAGLIVALAAAGSIYTISGPEAVEPVPRVYVAPVEIDSEDPREYEDLIQYGLRFATIDQLARSDTDTLQIVNGESVAADDGRALPLESAADVTVFMSVSLIEQRCSIRAWLVRQSSPRGMDQQTFRTDCTDARALAAVSGGIAAWVRELLGADPLNLEPADEYGDADFYHALVRARRAFQVGRRDALRESLKWYERALELNPRSRDALGGKALALAVVAGDAAFPSGPTYTDALALADEIRATVGPTVESELVRGFIFLYRDWDLDRSSDAFGLAVSLSPGNPLVHAWRAALLAARGETDAAAAAADLAVRLDPLSMAISTDRCWYLGAAQRLVEAVDACRWTLEMQPGHFWSTVGLVTALQQLGQPDAALEALLPLLARVRTQAADAPGPDGYEAPEHATPLQSAQCELAARLRARAEDGRFPLTEVAALAAQCGDYPTVVALLARAKSGGESGALFYAIDPRLAAFRADPMADQLDMRITPRRPEIVTSRQTGL